MQIISTLNELDERLGAAADAARTSEEEFRKVLDGFVLSPKRIVGDLPKDPGSERYRLAQMSLYEIIAGSSYKTLNEATPFDHAHMIRWPFPYSSRSPSVVGSYLMTYGNLIKTMNLDKDARILEIGSGFGPLTFHLASLGHHVTCVDVHEPLLDYVRERTKSLPGIVATLAGDMNDLKLEDTFDAIIFFESFHHGSDHAGLLRMLPRWLEPNGLLVLAGEPIVPSGSIAIPYPWGVRLDGLSLWCIRKHGWLELGFQENYLRTLLEASGWSVLCKSNHEAPTMGIWMAKRTDVDGERSVPQSDGLIASWLASDIKFQTQAGTRNVLTGNIESTGAPGFLLFGPYCSQDSGFFEVQWEGIVRGAHATGRVDVACGGGQVTLRAAEFNAKPEPRADTNQIIAYLRFKVSEAVNDLEFRMQVDAGTHLELTRVVLRKGQPRRME